MYKNTVIGNILMFLPPRQGNPWQQAQNICQDKGDISSEIDTYFPKLCIDHLNPEREKNLN